MLETDQDLPAADPFTVERIAKPGSAWSAPPDKLFAELERRELMPVRIKHGNQDFTPATRRGRSTRFPKASARPREAAGAQTTRDADP